MRKRLILRKTRGGDIHEGFGSRQPAQVKCLWCRNYLTDPGSCVPEDIKPQLAMFVLKHPTRWRMLLRNQWDNTPMYWIKYLRNSLGPKGISEMKTADILKWETLRK